VCHGCAERDVNCAMMTPPPPLTTHPDGEVCSGAATSLAMHDIGFPTSGGTLVLHLEAKRFRFERVSEMTRTKIIFL
jgi:hypothetical protein